MSFGMKETDHSLRLYFGFIGMLGILDTFLRVEKIYVASANVSAILTNPIVVTSIVFSLFVGVTYLFLAITLRTLLVTNPNVVRGVIIASLLLAFIGLASSFLSTSPLSHLASFMVELAIGIYLLANVNRLVREQRE